MALKRFVKSSGTGDKYPTQDHMNKPVFVQPIETFTGLKTDYDENGDKVVIRCNVYDIEAKQAYGRVVFFNDALVDGLKQYLGEETVVRFVDIKTKDGKRTFRGMQDGSDSDYAVAEGMMDEIHAAIEARLEELDADGGPSEGAPAQNSAQAAAVKSAFKRS